ncbi:MAG: hypothetical protein ABR505_10075 [Actinomycetota bacterium]
MRKVVVTLLVVGVVGIGGAGVWFAGRSEPANPRRPRATRSVVPPRVGSAQRAPTVRIENLALGKSRARVAAAVASLKEIELWRRLTRHLYIVRLGSRPGVGDVPDDRHLADAYLRAQIDEGGAGGVCDIMFYPRALKDDLQRATDYYSQGLGGPPPALEDFWAAILAHELAHCLPYKTKKGVAREAPEPLAERWEARVLRRLQG